MGYSIMTVFKTEEEKNNMKLFLDKNFKSFNELLEGSDVELFEMNESQPPTDDAATM